MSLSSTEIACAHVAHLRLKGSGRCVLQLATFALVLAIGLGRTLKLSQLEMIRPHATNEERFIVLAAVVCHAVTAVLAGDMY